MFKIILIEDDIQVLRQLNKIITGMRDDFKVSASFTHPIDAIEYLNSNKIDAIITDIQLPEMSGIELCEYCSTHFPNVKCAILSAYDYFEYAQKAIDAKTSNSFAYMLSAAKQMHDGQYADSLKTMSQINDPIYKVFITPLFNAWNYAGLNQQRAFEIESVGHLVALVEGEFVALLNLFDLRAAVARYHHHGKRDRRHQNERARREQNKIQVPFFRLFGHARFGVLLFFHNSPPKKNMFRLLTPFGVLYSTFKKIFNIRRI